jgi:hypothetical protein
MRQPIGATAMTDRPDSTTTTPTDRPVEPTNGLSPELRREYQDALALGVSEDVVARFDAAVSEYLEAWTRAIKRVLREGRNGAQRAREA